MDGVDTAQELVDIQDSDKLAVLHSNEPNPTLNLQSFGGSLSKEIIENENCDGNYETISVDIDGQSTSITGFLQQDGQFLHVEGITADDANIYLPNDTQESLTYIVSQSDGSVIECESDTPSNTVKPINGIITAKSSQSQSSSSDQAYIDATSLLSGHVIKLPAKASVVNKRPVSLLQALNVPISVEGSSQKKESILNKTEILTTTISRPDDRTFQNVTLLSSPDASGDAGVSYIFLVANPNEMESHTSPNSSVINVGNEAASVEHNMVINTSIPGPQDGNELVACTYCDYTTTKRYLLARHMKTHSEDRPHRCSICNHSFKTYASLTNHVNTHSGIRPHKCKWCESAFTTSGELIRHIRYKHTFEKPHKCTECEYASVELSKMKRHMRTHTGERPYRCTECSYASPDSYKLKRHMRIHTGEKPYVCDICSARFTQSNSLKAHRLIHTGNKPVFQCQLCPATCGRRTDLKVHMQKLHSREKIPLECRKCHRTFDNRYNYKLHMKSHDGEKTYRCPLCEFATLTERRLEDHLIVQHEDHKPYKCEEEGCEHSFRYRGLFKRHKIFTHTNADWQPLNKPYECPCGKNFVMRSNQVKHQELHSTSMALSTMQSILKQVEEMDEIGEEVTAEINEEIINSNPSVQELQSIVLPVSSSSFAKRNMSVCDDQAISQRISDIDGGNMVMRRIVQEVDGHRVVVMEVGPPSSHELVEETTLSGNEEVIATSTTNSSTMSSEHENLTAEPSVSQSPSVQILYNLTTGGHDTASHEQDDMNTLSPSQNVVTLPMVELSDNVISVAEANDDEHCLEDNNDQSNLEHISLSVQDASNTLIQLKRRAMDMQHEQAESLSNPKRHLIVD